MILFYAICVVLSASLYLWLCITDVKKSLCQNIMILIMISSNLGYLSLGLSNSIPEAILSIKIYYLGGSFLPLLYFFTVCEICHVSIKKIIRFSLGIFQTLLYCLVCTIGYSQIYYKSVQFFVVDGVGTVIKEYGPTHFLYPLSMYGYFIASFVTVIYAINKKKAVNRKEVRNMLICATLAVVCYVVSRTVETRVEFLPVAYIILMIGALLPIYHSNLFTVDENQDIIREQINKVGFITFDKNMKFMDANQYALGIFPELRECEVGKHVIIPGKELYALMSDIQIFRKQMNVVQGQQHAAKKKIIIGESVFDTEIHTVNNFMNRCQGYTIELTDETEHYRMLELTEKFNEDLTKEVERKTERIRNIQSKTILGMAQIVESRDLSTGGHIKRTSDVVRIFSKKLLETDMGLDRHFLELVIRSAPMHDLGKIGVDDIVLRKQGKFTDEEYDQMKKHAEIGGKMVRDILTGVEEDEFVKVAYNVAYYHHEKVNGKGYPCGLKKDEIPLEARIMALADVFDALVSKRCYKDAFSFDKAFSIIEEDAGAHFDYNLAMVFLKCRPELEEYYSNCEE